MAAGIPCLGIEPTASTAAAAERLGIPVLREFFGERLGRHLAADGKQADLIAGNNVYAHVPDINDFTRGLKAALKPGGTITLEFPHVMRLARAHPVRHRLSRTFFLSFAVHRRCASSRPPACASGMSKNSPPMAGACEFTVVMPKMRVRRLPPLARYWRKKRGEVCNRSPPIEDFQAIADRVKNDLLYFLLEQKRTGKKVAAYGAAAKGNTLLNYAGVKPDLLPFVCDAAAAKQGKFMPGSHIPILPSDGATADAPTTC